MVPWNELVPRLLSGAAAVLSRPTINRVARMVIGESRNFPDLARIWHDEVVSPVIDTVSRVIARAQARGEVRAGDPRLHAFSSPRRPENEEKRQWQTPAC
jgi:hypothetical protein